MSNIETSAIDAAKTKNEEHKLSLFDMSTFSVSTGIKTFHIFIYFVTSSLILYACKVSKSNILPTDTRPNIYETFPLEKDTINKYLNIFYSKDDKNKDIAMKISFPYEGENQKNSFITILNGLRNEPNSSFITRYFVTIMLSLINFNYISFNGVLNLIDSFPELLIILFSPIIMFFFIILLNICDALYFIFLWLYNLSIFFDIYTEEEDVANDKNPHNMTGGAGATTTKQEKKQECIDNCEKEYGSKGKETEGPGTGSGSGDGGGGGLAATDNTQNNTGEGGDATGKGSGDGGGGGGLAATDNTQNKKGEGGDATGKGLGTGPGEGPSSGEGKGEQQTPENNENDDTTEEPPTVTEEDEPTSNIEVEEPSDFMYFLTLCFRLWLMGVFIMILFFGIILGGVIFIFPFISFMWVFCSLFNYSAKMMVKNKEDIDKAGTDTTEDIGATTIIKEVFMYYKNIIMILISMMVVSSTLTFFGAVPSFIAVIVSIAFFRWTNLYIPYNEENLYDAKKTFYSDRIGGS